MAQKSIRVFALSDLDLKAQMIISEQIRKHLEKTGSVYPDEWGFTSIGNTQIQFDLTTRMD